MPSTVSAPPDERERKIRSGSSESITEALIACVKACGGSKQVAPLIWPDKTPDAAQRYLLDCLNEDRPQNLTPDQVVLVLRLARDRGCHAGMEFLSAELSYQPPVAVKPVDEADALRRQVVEGMRTLQLSIDRLNVLEKPIVLRGVA